MGRFGVLVLNVSTPIEDMSTKKEAMWNIVKSKFVFQKIESGEFVNEETIGVIKAWALEDMSTKWRQWKNELKSKYYVEAKTPEQIFEAVTDSRVDKNQFLAIAAHWLSTKSKDQSAINRENRLKSLEPHCAGTKSFSRIIHTMTEEAHGIPPSRADVYVRTRTRKGGNYANEKAAEVVERIKEIRLQNDDHSEEVSWTNDVFSKAAGPEKRGRIRCSGLKSTSSNRSGPSCSQPMQPNEEVQGLRSEIATLKTTLNGVLGVLRRQFPNETEDLLNTSARVVDEEVADAGSAPGISPHRNDRSSESTHQPSPINDDDDIQHNL
ncbi:Transposase, Ptta/En/Spm, plant [Corchorus capsularis]|uniref:Transposase, Ptta/En/Spm, plant n=1 Tax=Corchorus capsularis TaxID=210143 RepID=A0A1R3HE57_COCAP|nr:Transposase, Ptta/En/Spm, plant [Corchorus capsularis]